MGRHHSQPTLSLLNSHSLSGNVLEGRKATNQSQFSLGRPLGRLEIYGNDSTLCADTREVATEHPGCPRSHHLQPDQEASEDGWEEISTGERGRCQGKVVAQSCMQTNWRRSSSSRSRTGAAVRHITLTRLLFRCRGDNMPSCPIPSRDSRTLVLTWPEASAS